MRRRILIGVSIFLGVGLILFVGGWLIQPKPRIDKETFDQIKEGMTQREVEEIIGAPPGDFGVGTGDFDDVGAISLQAFKGIKSIKIWLGQQQGIVLRFDADGKVSHRDLCGVYREFDSNFDRLLGMIGFLEKKPRRSYRVF